MANADFKPVIAQAIQLRFGSFVDAATGGSTDVVFLTVTAQAEGEDEAAASEPTTYALSLDQARQLGKALVEGNPGG